MNICNSMHRIAWSSLLAVFIQINAAWAETSSANKVDDIAPVANFIRSNLTDHPDLIALKAELQSVSASLRASDQATFNPELELEYEDTDIKTKSIGISQTIDWGDQQGSRFAVARAEHDKAKASYQIAKISLVKDMLSRLADYQTGEKLVQFSNQSLNLMKEFKQVAERRYQAGDLTQVEFNLASLAHNQALMEHVSTLSRASDAREKLRALLGGLPDAVPGLPDLLPAPILEKDLDTYLQQLPAVRQQVAEVQLARQTINLRKSEQAWNPTLGLSAGTEGEESLIGISLSIPLNVRNNYGAEVDAAQQSLLAQEQRAHMAFRDTRANLLAIFERYRNLRNAWNSWHDQSNDSVSQQLSLIKRLWKAGDISATDYLLQLKQALETQTAYFELRNEFWQAAFEWMSLTASIEEWLNIDAELLGKY